VCSAGNAGSTFSGKTEHTGRLHVLLMLIFTLFLTLERSRVEVVIRLLGCRLLCKVFALYGCFTPLRRRVLPMASYFDNIDI
jgi:hypothetical protein